MLLRPAHPDDLPALWSIFRQAYRGLLESNGRSLDEQSRETFDQAVGEMDSHVVAVDGRTVGYLLLERKDNSIHIDELAIDPDRQNKGLGTAVIREVTDRARGQGLDVTLSVW